MRRFLCPGCETSLDPRTACPGHLDVRSHPEDLLVCTLCCPHCRAAARIDDPGGRVVWDTHGWRGLDGSEHRARRHT
jgi:RNase P subunit RPR2